MSDRLKIIVVDDDVTTLRVLGAALAQKGHQVIERETAIGTTLAIMREKPDVVLLDVRMPGLSGDKLASLIDQGAGPAPVVILHSSSSLSELEHLARVSGASGVIRKTADPAEFLARFDEIVSAHRRPVARRPA